MGIACTVWVKKADINCLRVPGWGFQRTHMHSDLVAQEGFHVERPLDSPLQNLYHDNGLPRVTSF